MRSFQRIGGAFELNYSVNPVWEADFERLPKHPITNGVKPFRLRDEWYYGMRWIDENTMGTVLLRHFPELAPALRGVQIQDHQQTHFLGPIESPIQHIDAAERRAERIIGRVLAVGGPRDEASRHHDAGIARPGCDRGV